MFQDYDGGSRVAGHARVWDPTFLGATVAAQVGY